MLFSSDHLKCRKNTAKSISIKLYVINPFRANNGCSIVFGCTERYTYIIKRYYNIMYKQHTWVASVSTKIRHRMRIMVLKAQVYYYIYSRLGKNSLLYFESESRRLLRGIDFSLRCYFISLSVSVSVRHRGSKTYGICCASVY